MNGFWLALMITAVITYFLRGLPFFLFANRDMPRWLKDLGESLPSAVMACLIIYCIKSTTFTDGIVGLAPLLGVGFTAIIYGISHSMFLSMLLATAFYMFLLTL